MIKNECTNHKHASTHHHWEGNADEPKLKDDEKFLSHVANDPSDAGDRQDDPVKQEFWESLSFVVHDDCVVQCVDEQEKGKGK